MACPTFSIARGINDNWTATWTFYSEYPDSPMDLSGYNAEFCVYERDGTALFCIDTLTEGGITLGGAAGTADMEKDLQGLDDGRYKARFVLINPDGNRRTYAIGEYVIA